MLSSCGLDYNDVLEPMHPENSGDPVITGDAAGHYDFSEADIFGFSQGGPEQEDLQVYDLAPDVNMRAWQKWHLYGLTPDEYNVSYLENCRSREILFFAGGTIAFLFADEFSDQTVFMDLITRDARGNIVEFASLGSGYHGSLANPAYRTYITDLMKMQIDLDVDGLFLDELNVGYSGGEVWSYNGNEGYDDYFIKDFNRYLINKYPKYTEKDWHEKFRMTKSNIIRRDVPYYDLSDNFNYREYLALFGWDDDPHNSVNPLAAEWGHPVGNRYDFDDTSFTSVYTGLYIKEIIITLREYARDNYSKELLITANGIMPWTDFNSLGLYEWNHDDPGNPYGADYVPVVNGHLNGSVLLKDIYMGILEKSRDVSGDVPLVLFMDWPCTMIDGYYNLPRSEKEDFWQIYTAEAYACGLKFAFHLKSSMPDEPTATESGILDFLVDYSQFYKENAEYYREAENTEIEVSVSGAGTVMTNVTEQEGEDRYLLHLVNHNYSANHIVPQTNVVLSLDMDEAPASITLFSPDLSAVQFPSFTVDGDTVNITVAELNYYNLLVIE